MTVYTSKAKGLSIAIRDAQFLPPDPSGYRVMTKPVLEVNFSDSSVQGSFSDTENMTTRHDVRGGAFDTDEAARRLGWDEEDKQLVEFHLNRMASDPHDPAFQYVNKFEAPVPVAPLPNWENLSPPRVLALAAELGIVREALEYERATQNRPELVAMLEKKAESLREEETLVAP